MANIVYNIYMKKKILIGILSFVMCLTFGFGCYFVFGEKNSLQTSAPQPQEETQTNTSDFWSDEGNYTSFLGGGGTADNPYLIQNARNFAYLSGEKDSFKGKYFKLLADIDMSEHFWTNNGNDFQGVFDGNNHKITGVNLKGRSNSVALFSAIAVPNSGEGGIIKNISLLEVSCDCNNTFMSFAGLTVNAFRKSKISNVNVKFTMNNPTELTANYCYIGGLFAHGYSVTVENCTADVMISCGNSLNENSHLNSRVFIGGIAGLIEDSDTIGGTSNFINCNSFGAIKYQNPRTSSMQYVDIRSISIGGLVGESSGKIAFNKCMNAASIQLNGYYKYSEAICLGGILGRLSNTEGIPEVTLENDVRETYSSDPYNTIEYSFNQGSIKTVCGNHVYSGGICGVSDDAILIRNCFNNSFIEIGEVYYYDSSGELGTGGIIGRVNINSSWKSDNINEHIAIITDCLNNGDVSTVGSYENNSSVGGIVGCGGCVKINRCVNEAVISNRYDFAGGIIGKGIEWPTILGNCIDAGVSKGLFGYSVYCNYSDALFFKNYSAIKTYSCYTTNSESLNEYYFTSSFYTNWTTYDSSYSFEPDLNYYFNPNIWVLSKLRINLSSGLMGWHVRGSLWDETKYYNLNWLFNNGLLYYPKVTTNPNTVGIGGIYLYNMDSREYQELYKEFGTDNQMAALQKIFNEISVGGKVIYNNTDIITYEKQIDGHLALTQTTLNVKWNNDMFENVDITITSSPQLYYDGISEGEPSKKNPVFQPYLKISDLNQYNSEYSCYFTPIFNSGGLSAKLYIYLTAKLKIKYKFHPVKGSSSFIEEEDLGQYLNTTLSGFNRPNSYDLYFGQTVSYLIRPKFGYAFYGISSTTGEILDLVDNTKEEEEKGQNYTRGNSALGNNFYLGGISGSFTCSWSSWENSSVIVIHVKEVKYGLQLTYGNKTSQFSSYVDDEFQLGDLHYELNNALKYSSENGYYFSAYYDIFNKESEYNPNEQEKLKTFVDVEDTIYNNIEDKEYFTLNFDDVKTMAKELNDINHDLLPVVLKRYEMKTKVILNDYQNYFYNLSKYDGVELTEFAYKKDATLTYVEDARDLIFVANTNKYGEENKEISHFKFNPNSGYWIDYISVVEGYQDKDRQGEINISISRDDKTCSFKLEDIYSKYLKNLKDFTAYLSIDNLEDRVDVINVYIYYSLMQYTINVNKEWAVKPEQSDNVDIKSTVSLTTNENKGEQDYSNTSVYEKISSENIVHYNSGLMLHIDVKEGERLAGVYINGSLVDISAEKDLMFYYSIYLERDTRNQMETLPITVVFAKYDTGTAPTESRGIYYISKPEHLLWLSHKVASGDTCEKYLFKQSQDIDMSGVLLNPIGGVLDDGTVMAFKGTYDGNFYRITNLSFIGGNYQNNLSYMGLFGYVEDATIMNLMVEGTQLVGWKNVGGVVGYAKNSTFTRVDNRTLAVSINSQGNNLTCAGVTFIIDGEESATNTVAANENFGGLVGYAEGCSFLGCSNQAGDYNTTVGLIGTMSEGSLDQCFTTYGKIVANEENAKLTDYAEGNVGYQSDSNKWFNGKLKIFYWDNSFPQN